jgi:hypothetical protein
LSGGLSAEYIPLDRVAFWAAGHPGDQSCSKAHCNAWRYSATAVVVRHHHGICAFLVNGG